MAQRIAGIATLSVDGNQMPLRGNFTVSPSTVERTMLAGQDGIHGYQELPRIPYIEADFSTLPDFQVTSLLTQVDVTLVAQLANGRNYQLTNATCKDAVEINTRDGQFRARWEGLACREYT
jgi:hypothetical protein